MGKGKCKGKCKGKGKDKGEGEGKRKGRWANRSGAPTPEVIPYRTTIHHPKVPTPEPEPVSDKMSSNMHEPQESGVSSWSQYATCGSMSSFGILAVSSNEKQQAKDEPFVPTDSTVHRESLIDIGSPNHDEGTQPTMDLAPQKCDLGPPLLQQTERTLEDLYRDYPHKKLDVSIEPHIWNLASEVILHVLNEGTLSWCHRWCPDMKWNEMLERVRAKDEGGNITDAQFVVPPEALDMGYIVTDLVDMFRQCHNVHPKGSGDIKLLQLLVLLTKCTLYMCVLKDDNRKLLLQATKSSFQRAIAGLGTKKLLVESKTVSDLEALNKKHDKHQQIPILAKTLGVAPQQIIRKRDELRILDDAMAKFDEHRWNFTVGIVTQLKSLMEIGPSEPQKDLKADE